ncbi:MAG: aminotransferase class I/II-fold pyridoxal phosphate-dependent enzyme [Gammaproteobacteria bacterium]|nr:aminotransferase class I/II-fold pyridoxal phosphate-dependent enzyme [Gammaproteobacteria bacterium]MCP5201220.1 aminotransferase class I/II-fold pyridoxal phosphate-dependent enzyme [Gammaproteobacteria bacterium]
MSLSERFRAAAATRDLLAALPVNPTDIVIDEVVSATEAMIHGRRTIMAGTNNYLGLTFDPQCIEAGQRALAEAGTGTTGSRMANGTYRAHLELEQELAAFFDMPHAMVFSTGYAANLGSLVALLGEGDAVLLDSEAHASLFDGCRMSGADIFRFKHNDPDGLAKRLRRLGERARDALIVVEGLYSIRGDCAPLAEYAAIKAEHGGYLFVDEAHSLGVFGEHGRGLAEAEGVLEQTDFVVGTFSKSLGSIGGFCASRHAELGLFRYASRPYIFTASPCPSVIATTREALRQVTRRPELRTRVWHNAHRLYGALQRLGLQLGPHVSPVVGVSFSERTVALRCWQSLLEDGVYTNLILPPAAPEGGSLIRVSVTAAHDDAQVDAIAAAFEQAVRRHLPGCAA